MSEKSKINTKKYPPVPFKHFPGCLLAGQIAPDGTVWLVVQCVLPVSSLVKLQEGMHPMDIEAFGHADSPFQIQGRVADFVRYANDAEREVTE